MKLLFATGLLAIALAGCSAYSKAPAADVSASPPPQNYRATVTQAAKEAFFDPYSVRDASISAPFWANAVFDGGLAVRKGWVVCIKANAKNRMGAYIGIQPTLILFDGENVALTLSGPNYAGQVEAACSNATYGPFPEIEAA